MTSPVEKGVILVTGHDRRTMVREALSMLGGAFQSRAKEAWHIFIHPNLVNAGNQNACTHPDQVRGVLDHSSLIRSDVIKIGDAGFHDTKKAFKSFDYASLKRSGNIELVDLNDDETIPVASIKNTIDSGGFIQRSAAAALGNIGFSKTVAESDLNIVAVPAKMHSYYIATLSIKTHVVGSLVVARSPFGIHARWPWLHTGYHAAHTVLADIYQEHPASLAIIDGTNAMQGNGPASGTYMDLGWLIASFNPVAADALAAYLIGLDPADIGYLYFLNQRGFGPIAIREMEIIGKDPTVLRREIRRPDSYPGILEWKT